MLRSILLAASILHTHELASPLTVRHRRCNAPCCSSVQAKSAADTAAKADAALHILAQNTLAMLASSEPEATALAAHAGANRDLVRDVMVQYDVDASGQLEAAEAQRLFASLARRLLVEAAEGSGAAAQHARALLAAEEGGGRDDGGTGLFASQIREITEHLMRIADQDEDGCISLTELAQLFDGQLLGGAAGGGRGGDGDAAELASRPSTLELYELRGCLQLLPRIARHFDGYAPSGGEAWHDNVPGDSHTLLRWVAPTHERDGLSIVGLGRSADASCYYLPEWGLVLDAGLSTKTFTPKTVLLTHGHRDHTQALPVLARHAPFGRSHGGRKKPPPPPKVLLPAALEPLVRGFLTAESVLNYGRPQTAEENEAALGALDLHAVVDGDEIELPAHCVSGKRAMGVEVWEAPHKAMPAVSYGLFRYAKSLKPEYAAQRHAISELMRRDPSLEVTRRVKDRILFYSGDTTIGLLERASDDILRYRYIVHECTFLGPPSADLDEYASTRGHTHYAQLHRFICAAPDSIWILVHWSIRYSRQDVERFFDEQYGGVPKNVVLWI